MPTFSRGVRGFENQRLEVHCHDEKHPGLLSLSSAPLQPKLWIIFLSDGVAPSFSLKKRMGRPQDGMARTHARTPGLIRPRHHPHPPTQMDNGTRSTLLHDPSRGGGRPAAAAPILLPLRTAPAIARPPEPATSSAQVSRVRVGGCGGCHAAYAHIKTPPHPPSYAGRPRRLAAPWATSTISATLPTGSSAGAR